MSRPRVLSVPANQLPTVGEDYLQPQHSVKRQPAQQPKYQVDSGFTDIGSNGSSVSGGLHENEAFAMSPVRDQQQQQQHLSASASDLGRARPGKVAGGGASAAALHDSYHFESGGAAVAPFDNRLLDGDQCTSEFNRSPTSYQNSFWTRTPEVGSRLKASAPVLNDANIPSGSSAQLGRSRENMRLPPRPESVSGSHEYEELPGGGYQPPRPAGYLSKQGEGQHVVAERSAQIGNGREFGVARAVSTDSGRKKSNPLYSLRLSEENVGRGDSDETSSSVAELSRENHGDNDGRLEKSRPKNRKQKRRWSIVVALLSIVAVVAIVAVVLVVLLALGIITRGPGSTAPPVSAIVSPDGATTASPKPPGDSVEQRLASLQEQVMQLKNLTSAQAELLQQSKSQINDLEARLFADTVALRSNYSSLGSAVSRLDSGVAQCASNLTFAVSTLSNLVANVSKMPGPPGPPGVNGSQGAQGAVNLSLCTFYEKTNAGFITDPIPDIAIRPDLYWNMTVASASCGATAPPGFSLQSLVMNRILDSRKVAQYRCNCTSSGGASSQSQCGIYAWFCPIQR